MGVVKRELKNIDKQVKKDKRNVKQVKRMYDNAADEIEEMYASFYGRFSNEDTISMVEARQRSTKKDIAKYKRDAKKVTTQRGREEVATGRTNNRLELLKARVNLELIEAAEREQQMLEEVLNKQAEDEYKRQAEILGVALLVSGAWALKKPKESLNKSDVPHIAYTKKSLKEIINTRMDNAVWSERLWSNQALLRRQVETNLERSIIAGRNPRAMATELRKTVRSSVYNSERLMRTESSIVQIDIQKDSYKQIGIEEYVIVTEASACNICLPFDGQVFKIKDMSQGNNAPIFHPNCLCSTAAHVPRGE